MGRKKNADSGLPPHISRATRVLLNLSQEDLAEKTGISISTIRRFEAGTPMNPIYNGTLQAFYKAQGVVFAYCGHEIVGMVQGQDVDGLTFDV